MQPKDWERGENYTLVLKGADGESDVYEQIELAMEEAAR